jgi:hypothetical protein
MDQSLFERYPRVRLLLSLAAASVVFTGSGCGNADNADADGGGASNSGASGERTPATPEQAATAEPGDRVERTHDDGGTSVIYAVRGVVQGMPSPANDWSVRHEAIPEFIQGATGPDGTPQLGMNTMTMPFPTPEGYDLSDVDVGDKVMIRFEVDYAADGSLMQYEVISHELLPPETELNFAPLPGMGGGDDGDADGDGP